MIKNIFILFGLFFTCAAGITNAQDTLRSYFPSGKLAEQYVTEGGVREGIATLFYESGIKKAEVPYAAGKIDGMMKVYNENGKLKELINFENGRREGSYSRFDDNGKFVEELFYKNGRIEKDTLEQSTPVLNERDLQSAFFSGSDTSFYSFADSNPEPIGGWAALYGKFRIPDSLRATGTVTGYLYLLPSGQVLKTEILSGITAVVNAIIEKELAATLFTPPVLNGNKIKYKMPFEIKLTVY